MNKKPPRKYFEYDEPFSERYEKFIEPNIKSICDTLARK